MILGFDPDESEGPTQWVARLDCHHRRHVRHRPPLSSYPWVLDPAGREAHVGARIECGRGLTREGPEGLTRYRETRIFERESTPAGLRADHQTKAGVWGRVEVESGALVLCFAAPLSSRVPVEAGSHAAIPPALVHHVELDGPVRFRVSFWRPEAESTP